MCSFVAQLVEHRTGIAEVNGDKMRVAIHRKEKDGDWHIYPECFARETSKRAYNGTNKNCKAFKLDKSKAVSVGTIVSKPYLFICLVGVVWFARFCG